MWSLLGSLISNFLLLRDLFGYAIPGAVLLAIVARFEPRIFANLPIENESIWITGVVFVTASYVLGHILAAIGYTPRNISQLCAYYARKPAPRRDARTLYYRYLYPSMFVEADRRETLTILRVGLAIAILVSAFLPDLPGSLFVPFLFVGLFMIANAHSALVDGTAYLDSTLEAARKAEDNGIPFFHWGGDSDSGKSENPEQKTESEVPQASETAALDMIVVQRRTPLE
jgi:hypothetical protein